PSAPTPSGSAANSISSGGRPTSSWTQATTRFSSSFVYAVGVRAAARISTSKRAGFSRCERKGTVRVDAYLDQRKGLEAAGLRESGRSPSPDLARRSLDYFNAVVVGVANEAEQRAALPNRVRRALGLDPHGREALERGIHVLHRDRDVAVTGADLIRLLAADV